MRGRSREGLDARLPLLISRGLRVVVPAAAGIRRGVGLRVARALDLDHHLHIVLRLPGTSVRRRGVGPLGVHVRLGPPDLHAGLGDPVLADLLEEAVLACRRRGRVVYERKELLVVADLSVESLDGKTSVSEVTEYAQVSKTAWKSLKNIKHGKPYLVEGHHTLAVRLVILIKHPQLLKLADNAPRLELNVLVALAVGMQLTPKLKRIPVRRAELLIALLVAVPAVVAPVRDCLLELVALQLLVRPVLDGSFDRHVEGLPGFHERLAELVGLSD